jgi:3-dehydroquinate synthase
MVQQIAVNTPDGSAYTISIASGLLAQLAARAADFGCDRHAVIITNDTLLPLYARSLATALPQAEVAIMPDGEQYKSLDTVHNLYVDLVQAGADRHTVVIALGGGVVGDTAGYVAATYMRGIRFVQIPTTLLAMVDSSVGGKVGVDLPQGKNLIGAFKQPDAVIVDPDVLRTLPDHEWRCGLAEVIKHGLIGDEHLLDPAVYDREHAAELVERAVQVKVRIVQQDPFEHGVRAYLNLGHTFAHAIERVSEYGWRHGDAVGVGLLAAVRLSYQLGMCDSSLVDQVDWLLGQVGLPRVIARLDPEQICEAMRTDKKWKSGKSRFVLLRGLHQVEIVENVPMEAVMDVLQSLRQK